MTGAADGSLILALGSPCHYSRKSRRLRWPLGGSHRWRSASLKKEFVHRGHYPLGISPISVGRKSQIKCVRMKFHTADVRCCPATRLHAASSGDVSPAKTSYVIGILDGDMVRQVFADKIACRQPVGRPLESSEQRSLGVDALAFDGDHRWRGPASRRASSSADRPAPAHSLATDCIGKALDPRAAVLECHEPRSRYF